MQSWILKYPYIDHVHSKDKTIVAIVLTLCGLPHRVRPLLLLIDQPLLKSLCDSTFFGI